MLFQYQTLFVDKIGLAFRKFKKVIACAATGFGKSWVMAEIARRSVAKGNVVCIACHRVEIFEQTFKILSQFGITPGIISSGVYPMAGNSVYLCMVETFHRRAEKGMIEHFNIKFMILDECHLGNYYKIVKSSECYILGFTASPKAAGPNELNTYFDTIVCGPSISELQAMKRLAYAKTYSVDHDFSKVKMRGKDFDEAALMKEFKKPKLYDGAVRNYLEKANGLKALCYCVNVEHSILTCNQFRDKGIKAAHVDGTTNDSTRKAIFDMYRRNELEVIVNVGIATTGTDLPDTQCIIQNFATASVVKHVQTLGRGARVADGKLGFIVLDQGRNYIRHGTYGEDIDWVHIFNNPKAAITKSNKRAKKECSLCGAVIKIHLATCPYCGKTTPPKQLEKQVLMGATAKEVRDYRLKNLSPHLRRPLNELSDSELREYGRQLGFKPAWYHIVKKKLGR